jgi:hypothetical protein
MTSSNFRLIGSEVDCFKKLVYETSAQEKNPRKTQDGVGFSWIGSWIILGSDSLCVFYIHITKCTTKTQDIIGRSKKS